MSFELDPVFHTETMVKILHAQGQIFYATKLCEELVSKSSENSSAMALLEAIKKGQIPEKVPAYQSKVAEETMPVFDDTTEPGITFEAIEVKDEAEVLATEVQAASEVEFLEPEALEKERKLHSLNELLLKVQQRKYETH